MPEDGYRRLLTGRMGWVYLLDPEPRHIDMALQAGKKVVVRIYAEGETTYHLRHTPEQVVHWLSTTHGQYRHREVYFIVGVNEPNKPYDQHWDGLHAWLIRYGGLAIKAGFGVVLGGFNTSKSIRELSGEALDVKAGVWDDLLRFANNNPRCILDFHDYTTGRPWSQQVDRLDLIATRNHQPRPLIWSDPVNIRDQWHMGRLAPLYARAKELGLRIRWGLGECYHDHMGDLGEVREKLNARYGMGEFMANIRGTRSHYRYYAALSGQAQFGWHDFAFMVEEDLRWIDSNYPPEFEYMAIFAYNRHWTAYDWSAPEMGACIDMLLSYEHQERPTVIENKKPVQIEVLTTVPLRVRDRASIQGAVVGQLANGLRISTHASHDLIRKDGYDWLMLEYDGRVVYAAVYRVGDENKPFLRLTWGAVEESEIPEHPPGIEFFDLGPNFSFTVPETELPAAAAFYQAQASNPYMPDHLRVLMSVFAGMITLRIAELSEKHEIS
jgi:hypothetical protein